jgi:hypothetical protein
VPACIRDLLASNKRVELVLAVALEQRGPSLYDWEVP